MTWAKYGTEFFDQLVDAAFTPELDDACQLTHAQAIHYIYSVESMTLSFPKRALRRFATSTRAEDAAAELVRRGLWIDHGTTYEVAHHGEVIRQSIAAQGTKREKDRDRQRRNRTKASATPDVATDVTRDVATDVTRDVAATQTDSQTDNHSYDEEVSSGEEAGADVSWSVAEIPQEDPDPLVPMEKPERPQYCRVGGCANRPLPGMSECVEHVPGRSDFEERRARQLAELEKLNTGGEAS